MTRNLREEVDIAPYVERGVIDVHDPAVRDNINTLLTGALGQCFITPYIALEKVRKVLAYYHIFLPKTTFLEGDRGVEVFDIKQFGELAGMRNNGDVVTRVDGSQNLYFEYKMNDKGMYDIFCEIVTDEELDDLVDNVEDEINDEDAEDSREEKLDESNTYGLEVTKPEVTSSPNISQGYKSALQGQIFSDKNVSSGKKDSNIDESSESVDMAGPETGPKPYPGGPEIGMAIVAAIMKKKKDELKEQNIQSVHPGPGIPDTSSAAFELGHAYYKRTGKYPDETVHPHFKTGTKRPGQTPPSDTVGQRASGTPATATGSDPFKGIQPIPRNSPEANRPDPFAGIKLGPNPNYKREMPTNPTNTGDHTGAYRTLPDTGEHKNIKPTNLPDTGDRTGITYRTLPDTGNRPANIGTTPSPDNTGDSKHMQTAKRLGLQTNESVSYVRQLAEKHSSKKKVS